MFTRLTLFIGLIGIALTVHLWIQNERNFDRGCWGASSGDTVVTSPCSDPVLKARSIFLGISLPVWGSFFYTMISAGAFLRLVGSLNAARWSAILQSFLLAFAIPFTAYLVGVQVLVARTVCPLCMLSAGLVMTLGIFHLLGSLINPVRVKKAEDKIASVYWATGISLGTIVPAGALLLALDLSGDQRSGIDGSRIPQDTRLEDTSIWTSAGPLALNSVPGPELIAFLDPNCPHCGLAFEDIYQLAEQFRGRANFYIVPRVLWKKSVLQSQAIQVARAENQHINMWRLQFAQPKPDGLEYQDIERMFDQLGLSTVNLQDRLRSVADVIDTYRLSAQGAGVTGTPTFFLDGVRVARQRGSKDELANLIEAAINR